jgi:hypothetical protein
MTFNVTVAARGITDLVSRLLYWPKFFLFSYTLQLLQKFGLTLFTKILLLDSLHQCWVVLKIRKNTHQLSPWVYRHLLVSYIKIKEPVLVYNHGSLTNLKQSPNQTKESQVLCQYFHENHWFLILIFFKEEDLVVLWGCNTTNTRTSSSLKLKEAPTMLCTPNQIFISVANFCNQLANVFGGNSGQVCFAVQFSLTFWFFAKFTKFLHPQNWKKYPLSKLFECHASLWLTSHILKDLNITTMQVWCTLLMNIQS